MTEPKQYNISGLHPHIIEDKNGFMIYYEDYAQLKDEVKRLTNNCNYLDQKLDDELDKSAMLCGQVERLTRAGDAMASSIQFNEEMAQDYNGTTIVHQCVQRWNAAKEGKGQS
jgi:hypothetical protein